MTVTALWHVLQCYQCWCCICPLLPPAADCWVVHYYGASMNASQIVLVHGASTNHKISWLLGLLLSLSLSLHNNDEDDNHEYYCCKHICQSHMTILPAITWHCQILDNLQLHLQQFLHTIAQTTVVLADCMHDLPQLYDLSVSCLNFPHQPTAIDYSRVNLSQPVTPALPKLKTTTYNGITHITPSEVLSSATRTHLAH